MVRSAPPPVAAGHRIEVFDCGNPAFTDWLVRYARPAPGGGSAKTFLVCAGDRVAGYFSLTFCRAWIFSTACAT